MFTITREQLAELDNQTLEPCTVIACNFLQQHFPESADIPRNSLLEDVREQVHHARRYGFLSTRQITTYVITAYLLGKTFDMDMPAATTLLNDESLDPDEKSEMLTDWTIAIFRLLHADSPPDRPAK